MSAKLPESTPTTGTTSLKKLQSNYEERLHLLPHTGTFIELIPWVVDHGNGDKIKVVGKGETPVAFASITDINGFVVYILTTAPPSELEGRILRLEGARSTLNGLAPIFKTPVEHFDRFTGSLAGPCVYLDTVMNRRF